MKAQDLYFLFNPYTGLVKIGVAVDVQKRRRDLEHACGVALEVLAVFDSLGEREAELHEAFTAERQIGEWFIPTPDLMAVVTRAETIDALLDRYSDRIDRYRAEFDARKEEHRREMDRERQRVAVVRAEEDRIRNEEAEKRAAKQRRRAEREAARKAEAMATVPRAEHVQVDRYRELVAERTTLVQSSQRARNCANVGVRVAR